MLLTNRSEGGQWRLLRWPSIGNKRDALPVAWKQSVGDRLWALQPDHRTRAGGHAGKAVGGFSQAGRRER